MPFISIIDRNHRFDLFMLCVVDHMCFVNRGAQILHWEDNSNKQETRIAHLFELHKIPMTLGPLWAQRLRVSWNSSQAYAWYAHYKHICAFPKQLNVCMSAFKTCASDPHRTTIYRMCDFLFLGSGQMCFEWAYQTVFRLLLKAVLFRTFVF